MNMEYYTFLHDCIDALIFHLSIIRDKNENFDLKRVSFQAVKEINAQLPEDLRDEKLYKGKTKLEDCMYKEEYDCGYYVREAEAATNKVVKT